MIPALPMIPAFANDPGICQWSRHLPMIPAFANDPGIANDPGMANDPGITNDPGMSSFFKNRGWALCKTEGEFFEK